MRPQVNRVMAVLMGCLFALSFACNSSPSSTVSLPPIGPDPRQCLVTVTPNFGSYWPDLQWEHSTDRQCPLTVSYSGSPLPFVFTLTAGPSTLWQYSMFTVWNNQGQVKKTGSYYYFVPHGAFGNVRSTINNNYAAATGTAPYLDSALVIAYGGAHPPSYPWFKVRLPAQVQAAAPMISGSTYVVTGYDQSWSALVAGEPLSYRYSWYLNGVLISNDQYAVASVLEGSSTLRLEVTLSDEVILYQETQITGVNCGGPYIC